MGTSSTSCTRAANRVRCLLSLSALSAGAFAAAAAPREESALRENWRFHYGEIADVREVERDAPAWPEIALPHTWNAVDGSDGGANYARGTGWYVRRFKIDRSWRRRRVFIEFSGASRVATVFLNDEKIGEHMGGFARFRFELTDRLRWNDENTLAVRVSNADDDGIAPISADFTFFGGLYRGVRLFATDPLHIDVLDCASDGVYLTQKSVASSRAEIAASSRVRNDSDRAERVSIRTVIRDADGTVVCEKESPFDLAANETARCEQSLVIDQPHLWNGRADPYLYSATVSVIANGAVRDEVRERIGLRSFSVDPDRGFFLNGKHLDLHGVSRHQDRAGKGWAISDADDHEDFAFIREIGATALRVAHYPQSDLWFDLADETGLIVWAEIPVVNEVPGTELFADNARQQLRELIRQNYNRPAICFWGVGNETREMGETAGRHQLDGPNGDRLIAELAALVREEDPTRLSAYASYHRPEDKKNFHTDVLGYNRYSGWYGGTAEDFAAWADDMHRRFPTLRLGISEYGAGANIVQHDESGTRPAPGGAWHPEEYQAWSHEVHWKAMRSRDYLWAKLVWNLFDFAADDRSEGGTPGLNDKGLVTYDRKIRKDAFFWYKANWSDAPVLYIASRRFSKRTASATEVKVYSNAAEVELFLSGKSHGVARSDDHIFRWAVELSDGENRIEVRATRGSEKLKDECVWTLAKPETR